MIQRNNYPTPAQYAIDEKALARSVVTRYFQEFVREMWPFVVPEELTWNWHMTVICQELQDMAERVFQGLPKKHDLIINVPPGSTKSTLASVMFPAWVWTRMPSARSICGSHAASLALDLSRKTRDVIQCERYQALFPHIALRLDQNTKSHFVNEQGGGRYSCGIGGSVIGHHAHFLIIDDPLDPQEALSEVELKSANDWMNETLPSRKVDKQITPTILIMQRLHQNDPTGNMLERMNNSKGNDSFSIKHICLPADCSEYEVKPKKLKRFYKGNLLDPKRMPKSVLREAMSILGAYAYSGQYGQSPAPPGGGMFKVGRINIDTRPINSRFKKVIRYWDKAGTHDGGAYTVGVLMAMDVDGIFWILDVVRGQWDSDERELIIKQTCKIDVQEFGRFNIVFGFEQEPGSSGLVDYKMTAKNLAGMRVKADKPTGDKILRADPFSSAVNSYQVKMVPATWNKVFIDELRYFPESTYKDQVDAAAGAYNMLASVGTRVGAL